MQLKTMITPLNPVAPKRVVLTATIYLTKDERRDLFSVPAAAPSVLNHLLVPHRFNNGVAIYVHDLVGKQCRMTFSNGNLAEAVEDIMHRNGVALQATVPLVHLTPIRASRAA